MLTYSAYLLVSLLKKTIDPGLAIALTGGGLLIAVVGWADDRRGLSAGLRLAVHLAASIWALLWIRPLQLDVGVFNLQNSIWVYVLSALLIAWCTNLFNFMDGIDGIASTEAISCGLAIWFISGAVGGTLMAGLGLALASSVAGFLPMNWSPAKIFMGDVGSGYLGFTIGTLAVASGGLNGPPAWVWLTLLGVFVTDATLTLLRRILQRESWHEAHRTHVYQLAVQAGHSHRAVSTSVLVINVGLAVACSGILGMDSPAFSIVAVFAVLVGSHALLYRLWSPQRATASHRGVSES